MIGFFPIPLFGEIFDLLKFSVNKKFKAVKLIGTEVEKDPDHGVVRQNTALHENRSIPGVIEGKPRRGADQADDLLFAGFAKESESRQIVG